MTKSMEVGVKMQNEQEGVWIKRSGQKCITDTFINERHGEQQFSFGKYDKTFNIWTVMVHI